eukprot:966427-Prymnesium_polylepis.2
MSIARVQRTPNPATALSMASRGLDRAIASRKLQYARNGAVGSRSRLWHAWRWSILQTRRVCVDDREFNFHARAQLTQSSPLRCPNDTRVGQ